MGQLLPTDSVWTQGMARPIEAGTLPALFPLTAEPVVVLEPVVVVEPVVDFAELDPKAPPSTEMAERSRNNASALCRRRCGNVPWARPARSARPPFGRSATCGQRGGCALRRLALDAQTVLGQRMFDTQAGDPELRGQVRVVGERILSLTAVKGATREATAERRGLLLRLAEPALAQETAPPGLELEHQRARAVQQQLRAQQEQAQGLSAALRTRVESAGDAWRSVMGSPPASWPRSSCWPGWPATPTSSLPNRKRNSARKTAWQSKSARQTSAKQCARSSPRRSWPCADRRWP